MEKMEPRLITYTKENNRPLQRHAGDQSGEAGGLRQRTIPTRAEVPVNLASCRAFQGPIEVHPHLNLRLSPRLLTTAATARPPPRERAL